MRSHMRREPVVPLPPCSPNLSPHPERFTRSVKEEFIERMIFFGERSLQVAVAGFLSRSHTERNHQGLGSGLIGPEQEAGRPAGEAACRERLGGMLRHHYRKGPALIRQIALAALARLFKRCVQVTAAVFTTERRSGYCGRLRLETGFRSLAVD